MIGRVNPRYIALAGMLLMAAGLYWYSLLLSPDGNIAWLLLPSAVLGLANAGIWSPISTTATHDLDPRLAGAGSGVYNTTRQVGAVLGSASIAALMQARLTAELPSSGPAGQAAAGEFGGTLPAALHDGFTAAMAQSLLLPAAIAVLGAVVVLFFAKPKPAAGWDRAQAAPAAAGRSANR
jgi:hypothetical protein